MRHLTSRNLNSTSTRRVREASTSRVARRSGQALIEFAVIAFVLTLLLGAMLTFGFMIFGANVLQQAADVGAMELARHPYSPTGTFSDALSDVDGTDPLFLEEFLVCEIGGSDTEDLPTNYDAEDYDDLQGRMPLINRLLLPLYIFDPDVNQPNGVLRYPGTVVERDSDNQKTVVIPIIGPSNRDTTTGSNPIGTNGADTISEWRRVVDEVVPTSLVIPPSTEGPYAIDSTNTGTLDPGTVALRINYPYQSAAFVAYVHTDENGNVLAPPDTIGRDGVLNVPITANDGAVTGADTATFPDGQTLTTAGYSLVNPTADPRFGASPHRGTYGFGEAQAFLATVRPYRKVLTAQGIYRREVFE